MKKIITKIKNTNLKITRKCVICGKKFQVIIKSDNKYTNSHYLGEIEILEKKKAEYWECSKCAGV